MLKMEGKDEKEKKYQEVSHLVEALFDAIPDIIGVQDINHGIIRYNKAGYKFLGKTPEQVKGKKCFELISLDHQCDVCATSKTIKTKKAARVEKYFPELEVYFDVRSYPVFDDDGQLIMVIEHLRDITEQKKAEAAVLDGKNRIEAILSALPDLMFIFDSEGVFVDFHTPNQEMLLIPPKNFLNKKMVDVLPPEIAEEGMIALHNLFKTKKPQTYSYNLVIKGEKRYFESQMVKYGENKALSINRDFTEFKKNEQERQQLREQILHLQKMEALGRLAGGIAHDFNNILVPIMGFAELGLQEITPEHKLYSDLENIRDSAKRAANLTRQILAFSRKQVLTTSVVNLNVVINNIQTMIQRLIGEDIETLFVLEPKLNSVKVDKGQIEQVLLNIVLNARDAMPKGGKLTIETRNILLDKDQVKIIGGGLKPGKFVMLTVSDTGIGMDQATQERIFEPFFTTKAKGKGTGLGLSSAYGIVQQHDGNIICYSELNKGTIFKIYLPITEEIETIEPKTENTTESLLHGSETLLIVEDDDMVRKLICNTLQTYGYTTIEAADPLIAIQMADNNRKQEIQMIISDIIMPKMNGHELHKKIIQLRPNIKVLYISGFTENGIEDKGLLQEGVNFLQKPFSLRTLATRVRQILDA